MNSVQAQLASPCICPDRQLLILDAVRLELLPQAVREQLFEHLCVCRDCAKLYNDICTVHRDLVVPSIDLSSDAALTAAGFTTQEEGLEDIWRRIEAKEAQPQRDHSRHLTYRIGKVALALAACLLLAVSVLWWQGRTNSPSTVPSVALSAKRPMSDKDIVAAMESVSDDSAVLFSEPTPFDPAKVDYAAWCQEHEKRFAATFPWIFQAQAALQAKGIQADYLELLMVSGDIWQFQFDPNGPIDQPLAGYNSAATERLAKHYDVPAESLRGSIVAAVVEARSKGHADVSAAASLERWKLAVASAASSSSAARTDFLLSNLRAATYLHDVRTAACVWAARNPQSLQGVLVASGHLPASESPVSASVWVQSLARQSTAAQQMIQVMLGSLAASPSKDCGEAGEPWQRMGALLLQMKEDRL